MLEKIWDILLIKAKGFEGALSRKEWFCVGCFGDCLLLRVPRLFFVETMLALFANGMVIERFHRFHFLLDFGHLLCVLGRMTVNFVGRVFLTDALRLIAPEYFVYCVD